MQRTLYSSRLRFSCNLNKTHALFHPYQTPCRIGQPGDCHRHGLSYQWQRDGVNVANATGSSYTLGGVQMTDDGSRWTVVVTGAGGLGGMGNADGPVGRLTQPNAIAVDQAGVGLAERHAAWAC